MILNTEAQAPVITIDGPSGAGKGTLSRLVAQHLGYQLLDSGALYRLTALAAHKANTPIEDEHAVASEARHLDADFDVRGSNTRILLAGEEVSQAIRTEAVSMAASQIAAYPAVRAALLDRQREFRQLPGLVADGRDMGTAVFPDAGVKIFLTASPEARAERRYLQLLEAGETPDKQALAEDIRERDKRDSDRSVAPLKPADDAYTLDSTELSINQVLEAILEQVGRRQEPNQLHQ